MRIRALVVDQSRIALCCLLAGIWASVPSCSSENNAKGWSGPLAGTSSIGTTTATTGGSSSTASKPPCIPAAPGARPHEAGNYDNRSCNSTGCHTGEIGGGWVYASANGVPWVGGATITITNSDGSTVTSTSGEDGFFQITSKVVPPYKVCVSKCPGTDCNLTPHPNADCQTSNCHGIPTQRVYVSGNAGGASSSGGTSAMGGGSQNCKPPASGGPYTHTEFVYGNQPCSGGGCHRAPKPVFKGGFLYDGPDSTKTVAEATITLTQSNGNTTNVVSGPDGLFFFGTVGPTSVAKDYGAPYTACVSKCPLKICSTSNGHTNSDDCITCHDGSTTSKIYLK